MSPLKIKIKLKKRKKKEETNSVDQHEFCSQLVDKAGLACFVLFSFFSMGSLYYKCTYTTTAMIKKNKQL